MKFSIITLFMVFLCGCELLDEDSSNHEIQPRALTLADTDLSGTWLLKQETRETKIETGEYLLSSFYESKFILEDTERGVIYNECEEYGDIDPPYGIKTPQHFYMNVQDPGFMLQADGTLQQTAVYELEYNPGFSYESIQTLTKVSEGVDIDNGTLALRGPVSVEEYSHVCLLKSTSNIGNRRSYHLIIPFDNERMIFSLNLIGEAPVGTYIINDYYSANEVVIDFYSNSILFEETMNSSGLDYENATINIIESNEDVISGSFVIIDESGNEHSGEFELILKG